MSQIPISRIGLGCVTFGREIDRETSFGILDHAREKGITLYDTAEAYHQGASERILGEWIGSRGCREEIVLATKVTFPLTRERILKAADESLQRLGTDRIDLYQLHTWDTGTPLEETLGALQKLIQKGKVLRIGCSNFSGEQLRRALSIAESNGDVPLQTIQPPYNLIQREIEEDLLPLCAERKVDAITYSPLAAGFLSGKYDRSGKIPEGTRFDVIPGHQPIYCHERGFAILDRLRELSDERGESMVHLALAWVLQKNGVTSTLIGARHTGHVDQAFTAMQDILPESAHSKLSKDD